MSEDCRRRRRSPPSGSIRVDLSPARHLQLDDVPEPPEGLRAEVVGLQPSEGLADWLLASDSEVATRRVIHVLHGEVDDVAALIRHRAIDGEAIGQCVGCLAQQAVDWRCQLDRTYRHRSHYAGPAPEIRLDRQRSAHRPKPVSHVRETGPVAGVALRKAGAVIEHLEVDRLLLPDRDRGGAGPLGVLGRILKRLETTEVDGALDLGRIAPQTPRGQRRGKRTGGSRLRERPDQTAFDQEARIEPVGQGPNVGHGGVSVLNELAKPCGTLAGIALDKLAGELELDGQRQQPLLGAVVQIPLDTPALLVGRRHDAASRSLELPQRGAQLCFEPLVLERHLGEAMRDLGHHRCVRQRGIVHQRRDGHAAAPDLGSRAIVATPAAAEPGVLGRPPIRPDRPTFDRRLRATDRRLPPRSPPAAASRSDDPERRSACPALSRRGHANSPALSGSRPIRRACRGARPHRAPR